MAAPKLLAVSNAKVDGIDTASTTKPAGIAYAAVFVRVSKAVTNNELQGIFRTDALVGRYYRKGDRGFAKILVPDHELDRALSQNPSSLTTTNFTVWRNGMMRRFRRLVLFGRLRCLPPVAKCQVRPSRWRRRAHHVPTRKDCALVVSDIRM